MGDYVAFLRAVNLGPRRRVDMGRLRQLLDEAGMGPAATYLTTGNVRLSSPRRSPALVARDLGVRLQRELGFEVAAVVLPLPELARLGRTVEELSSPLSGEARHYVTLLAAPPSAEVAAALEAWERPGEAARVVDGHVHVWLDGPSRGAVIGNPLIERLAGTAATTRTARVVREVARRWT